MSEVLFGQSYYLRFDPKLWAAMQPYPPLGTLYAAGYLRAQGYDVALFDAMLAESEAEWAEALARERPRYAVLYEDNFNYLSKMCLQRMRQAAFAMLALARAERCTVIVAGSDATDNAGQYLDAGADYVLIGEGEATLAELLGALSGRAPAPLETILGLAYRDGAGQVVQTPRRPPLADLDALPFPAWDLVDVRRYQEIWLPRHGYYSMNMVTTRGCPYHCAWCAKPIWGQRYHARTPANVVAELRWLKERYAVQHIWFADDIMGLDAGWMSDFAAAVEQQGIRTPFKCLSRVDLLLRDGEIVALARAGCQTVWVGAESGSQKVLDAMDKGVRVEQVPEATRMLHAAGIQACFFLQFGYPGETLEDIRATRRMVQSCRPDDIGVAVSYPLPGTRFYEAVHGQLGEKEHWDNSSDLAMMYRGPFSTAFYRQLHTVVHREFRAGKVWDELRRGLGRPGALSKRQLRRAGRLGYYWLTLPVARLRLAQLARAPHQGAAPLPGALDHDAAASPSPQPEQS